MNKIIKLVLCAFLLVSMFSACGSSNPSGTYTVEVKTENGKVFEKVEVRVYTDTTKSDIVAVGKTDENGKFSFESKGSVGNVIYLEGLPMGYGVQEYYEIEAQDTVIALSAKLLSEDSLSGVTFQLGDVFADMSVITPDGKTYLISDILREKRAVVLNFWYLGCQPCRMEFPYLQSAYDSYKDVIEVVAINPMDGTDDTVSAYAQENGLTFPMAVCDSKWSEYMNVTAYPTTIVIDRYGTIAYMHTGGMEEADFMKLFEFFTAEDYEQTALRRLSDIQ